MKKHLYIISFMALGLVACQSEMDEVVNAVTADPVEVRTSFTAEFEDNAVTRTLLVDGSRVRWDAGDKIRVYGYSNIANGTHYQVSNWYADFETKEGGFQTTFSGNVYHNEAYYAFYPAAAISREPVLFTVGGKTELAVPMTVPSVQEATAGSFAKGLNLAYAMSSEADGNFKFSNVNALIGFKLAGTGVENIARVRFTPLSDVALTGSMYVSVADGSVHYVDGETYVELEGKFNTSDYFYMVAAPAVLDGGFMISFIDQTGKEFTKKGLTKAELKASYILDLGTIDVNSEDLLNGAYEQYFSSSKQNPVTMVVIAEGFTREQLGDYRQKAEEMIDFIFSVEPYKSHKSYFNVYIIDAVSNESGADETHGKQVDTFFDAGWEGDKVYHDMKANATVVYSFVSAHTPDILEGKSTINETGIFMLINDSRYAGICHNISDGRGYAMIPVVHDGDVLTWAGNKGANLTNTGTWKNIALHEGGGHMFGKLNDEYWDNYIWPSGASIEEHFWEVPMGLNIVADRSKAEWAGWIPSGGAGSRETGKFRYVGFYEGATATPRNGTLSYGCVEGLWRSEQVSCMDDNRAYFNAYSRYLIAKRIHEIAGESLTLDEFLNEDAQYKAIQENEDYAGAEGLLTTIYTDLHPTYSDASTRANYVETEVEIYPPLQSPVITVVEKPEIITID